jgi:hypothetical protein
LVGVEGAEPASLVAVGCLGTSSVLIRGRSKARN